MKLLKLRSVVKSLPVLALIHCFNLAPAQSITNPIAALKDHITGAAPLTASQIVTQGNLIQASINQVGTNDIALAAALDLVAPLMPPPTRRSLPAVLSLQHTLSPEIIF